MGFVSAHARIRAPNCLLGNFFYFFVLPIAYSQDASTDFDTKYVKRRGSAQECAFWGCKTKILTLDPYLAQNCHFGVRFEREFIEIFDIRAC